MLPEFYQIVLQIHLTKSQYLILHILVLLLQGQRKVQLATLARLFPQPIKYASRLRCLQRFLALPQLSLALLWYPIIKYWLRQEWQSSDADLNRASRRQTLKLAKSKYALVAIDRTQWREKNLFVASLLWKRRGIPLHWQLLPKLGSSNLSEQKRFLTATLKLLKGRSVVIIGDREFHSAKLGQWLQAQGVDFILRQKANNYLQLSDGEYRALNQQGFQVSDKCFYSQICSNKMEQIGYFNLAVYWKRGYRGKQTTDPWYLLTSLSDLDLTLKLYRQRWGIETMFKDCKTGGYNLEQTHVNQDRFLALFLLVVLAYGIALLGGASLTHRSLKDYLVRTYPETKRKYCRFSHFSLGLARYGFTHSASMLEELGQRLMATKPHKRLFFQRGLAALSSLQLAF